ncbi:MAG: hypothetical protein HY055_07905 [Magnetospirillum sp.]|nr:hypothetical protein [Magnetospirillum sp.]
MSILPEGVPGGLVPFPGSFVLCLITLWGLGGLLGPARAGLRLAAGGALLPLLMVGANFGLGMGLTAAATGVMILALSGLVAGRRSGLGPPLLHPVSLLPILVAVLVLWRGGLSYQPYSWDEFSAWLYWPREAFLLDDGRASGDWRHLGYTQGLVLSMLYSNLFSERFDEVRLLAYPVALHVAMLAVAFEVAVGSARLRLGLERRRALSLGWVLILGLLAAEASWTLVPQLLQAEKPQIYLAVIIFLLLVEAEADPSRLRRNALVAGLALAGGFLVKSGFLAMLIPAGLAVIALGLQAGRRDWPAMLLVLGPTVLAVLVWNATKGPVAGGCLGNPLAAFGMAAAGGRGAPLEMIQNLARGIADYVVAYKPGLTVLGLLGLAAGLAGRGLVSVAALIGLILIYVGSLQVVYAVCLNATEGRELASLPRYLRVILRIVHTLGPILLVLEMGARLRRHWPRFDQFVAGRAALAAGLVVVLGLAGWQVRATARALDNIASRAAERDRGEMQSRIAHEAEAVARLARETGIGRVTVLAQGSSGEEFTYGRYYAIGRRRGEPLHRFETAEEYSFAPSQRSRWITVQTPDEAAERLRQGGILWPQSLDPWLVEVLRPMMSDPACLSDFAGRVLLPGQDGRLVCRALSVD